MTYAIQDDPHWLLVGRTSSVIEFHDDCSDEFTIQLIAIAAGWLSLPRILVKDVRTILPMMITPDLELTGDTGGLGDRAISSSSTEDQSTTPE